MQWARDWFEGAFKQAPEDANAYLTNPEYLPHLKVCVILAYVYVCIGMSVGR